MSLYAQDVAGVSRRAADAWPAIPLSPARFAAFLQDKAPAGQSLESLRVEDLFLACACAEGIAAALEELERSRMPLVERAIQRVLRDRPLLVDDAVQMVRSKLLVATTGRPKIADYSGRGSLDAWLRATAVRVAIDLRRSEATPGGHFGTHDEGAELGTAALPDAEWRLIKEHHRPEFERTLGEALQGLSARDRTVLKLYAANGLSLEEIGKLYRVNRSTVSRWIAASRTSVLRHLRERFADQLPLDPQVSDGLFKLFQSGLNTSIGTLLADDKD